MSQTRAMTVEAEARPRQRAAETDTCKKTASRQGSCLEDYVTVSAGVVVVYAGVVVVLAGVVAVLGHSREDALVRPGYELSVTILNISTVIYVQRIVKRKVVLRGGRP